MVSSALAVTNQPELELLLCCARVSMDAERAMKIETLLAHPINWERVLHLAEINKLVPLLHYHLHAIRPDAVPIAILSGLRDRALAIATSNLQRTGELLRSLSLLESHGISAIPMKGPALAASAYGNLGLRHYNDLDILVRERDVIEARDL